MKNHTQIENSFLIAAHAKVWSRFDSLIEFSNVAIKIIMLGELLLQDLCVLQLHSLINRFNLDWLLNSR